MGEPGETVLQVEWEWERSVAGSRLFPTTEVPASTLRLRVACRLRHAPAHARFAAWLWLEAPSGGLPDATNPSYADLLRAKSSEETESRRRAEAASAAPAPSQVPSRLRALSSASEQEQSTQSRGWGRWGLGKFGRAERPGICWRRCWSPAPTAVSRHRRQRVSQCKLADRFNL